MGGTYLPTRSLTQNHELGPMTSAHSMTAAPQISIFQLARAMDCSKLKGLTLNTKSHWHMSDAATASSPHHMDRLVAIQSVLHIATSMLRSYVEIWEGFQVYCFLRGERRKGRSSDTDLDHRDESLKYQIHWRIAGARWKG